MAERKVTYEALEERVRQLETLVQECERLAVANRYAAAIMHEVNNPLEALTNLTYLLHHEALPSSALQHLLLMEEQIAVLTAVTRPSLAFHKDQRSTKNVDLVALVRSVHKLYEGRLMNAGVRVVCRCPESAVCNVVGSELLQVLSNLVLNAMDAMNDALNESTIHIRVQLRKQHVCVCVADNGPGIPAHIEQRLGEPYATSKSNGTGLGLWISKRIIEGHRGALHWRTSRRPGRSGTAFRMTLPCGPMEAVRASSR